MKKYLIKQAEIRLEGVQTVNIKPGYIFENSKDIKTVFEFDNLTDAQNFLELQETAFVIPFQERKVIDLFEFCIEDSETKEVISYSNLPAKECTRYEFYDDNSNVKYLGEYSFSALKMFFMPSVEINEEIPGWLGIKDLFDLEEWLDSLYNGEKNPYHWTELEFN